MIGFMKKISLYDLEYVIDNFDVRNDIKYLLDSYLIDLIECEKIIYHELNKVVIKYGNLLDVNNYSSAIRFEHVYVLIEELKATIDVLMFNIVRKLRKTILTNKEYIIVINSFMLSDGYILCIEFL